MSDQASMKPLKRTNHTIVKSYRVGQKTGPFLNIDNFTMVSGRKACVYVKSVQILCRKKYRTCIAMRLNMLLFHCVFSENSLKYALLSNSA